MMQKVLLGFFAVAAVAGWVAAFLSMSESSDLEDQIAAAKIELTKASEQLADTHSRLALTQGAASSLEDIDKSVAANRGGGSGRGNRGEEARVGNLETGP